MVALLEGTTLLVYETLRLREKKRYFKFNIICGYGAGQLINGLKLFAL